LETIAWNDSSISSIAAHSKAEPRAIWKNRFWSFRLCFSLPSAMLRGIDFAARSMGGGHGDGMIRLDIWRFGTIRSWSPIGTVLCVLSSTSTVSLSTSTVSLSTRKSEQSNERIGSLSYDRALRSDIFFSCVFLVLVLDCFLRYRIASESIAWNDSSIS
jgi:hypothetical protein